MKNLFLRVVAGAIFLAFLLAAALPSSAFAEEGDPPTEPAPSTTEESAAPVEEIAATAEPPDEGGVVEPTPDAATDESAPVEKTPAEEPAPTEEVNLEGSFGEVTLDESVLIADSESILAGFPEGTELAVLDPDGNPLPLASEGAMETLYDGDPQWCPVGVTPNSASCTPQRSTFALVLADLISIYGAAGPAQAGVIWVRDTYAAADSLAIDINGSALTTMKDFTLTIQGGWTGVGTTINQLTPSVFDVLISIRNWNANVTLSDILITGTSGGSALWIDTTKNIVLTRVQVDSNAFGVLLENDSGSGIVTVTNSSFSNTVGNRGLSVTSKGNITLSGVVANSNYGGAQLDNCILVVSACTAAGNIIISNSSFNSNSSSGITGGLTVTSGGAITLTNVEANSNTGSGAAGYGANLDNSNALSAKNVTIAATTIAGNEFIGNRRYGLQITSWGLVSIKDITASENGLGGSGSGLDINNTSGVLGVTMTGTNIFNQNADFGLHILTLGPVKLNNLIANSNGNLLTEYGVYINNSADAAQPVTLTGSSQFKFNFDHNLYIQSRGLVTLYNITANSSKWGRGVSIDNCQWDGILSVCTGLSNVTIAGTNTFNNNYRFGLHVVSNGNILVNNVTAKDNGNGDGHGVYLDNSFDVTSPYATVKVTGANNFSGNYSDGLNVRSNGAITVNSITANDNVSGSGATLNNAYAGIANSMQPVTLTGTSLFNGNGSYGLDVSSYGNILLNNITATGNGLAGSGYGASLDNSGDVTSTYAAVKLTGTNNFSGNDIDGLYVLTNGAITLNSVTANDSVWGSGATLDNTGFSNSKQPVILTGTNVFNDNRNDGLNINSYGAITINNITANANGLFTNNDGAELVNTGADTAQAVKLTGINVFDGNQNIGLWIKSSGAVTLNSVTASNTVSAHGAYVDNKDSGTAVPQNVTLTGTNAFNDNNGHGLWVFSYGAITLNSTTVVGNGSAGATLDNCFYNYTTDLCEALLPKNITLTGTNKFSDNTGGYGLEIDSRGAVFLNSVTAGGNASNGVDIDNCAYDYTDDGQGTYLTCAVLAQNVTISGTNVFSDNSGTGLYIRTAGGVSLSNITATVNSGSGVDLDNCRFVSPNCSVPGIKSFTLAGTNNINSNTSTGLDITLTGAITVNNLTANGNGTSGYGIGADLLNAFTAGQFVKLTGTNTFNANRNEGLYIETQGAVSLNNVSANDSLQAGGAVIYNNDGGAGSPQNVTLTGVNNFNDNKYDGLDIYSYGVIAIHSVTANRNGIPGSPPVAYAYGAYLDNCNWSGACTTVTPKAVILTGVNTFNDNTNRGLYVLSMGPISSATTLTASDNDTSYGALLDNEEPGALGGVSLLGVNTFNGNGITGLSVYSYGAITVSKLTADDNLWDGAQLANYNAATPQNVTISGYARASGNTTKGVVVISDGAISLAYITAVDNGSYGVDLSNSTEGKGVTISGTSRIADSTSIGLYITTFGPVTVNSLTSSNNGNAGVVIDSAGASGAQAVKFTGTNVFEGNTGDGLAIYTTGAITLNNVTASDNVNSGAYLVNVYGSAGVTITGANTFSGNDDDGLYISTFGSVILSKVTADGNDEEGLAVYTAASVTLTCGSFTNNSGYGVYLSLSGAVTLKGVLASGNTLGNFYVPLGTVFVRTC